MPGAFDIVKKTFVDLCVVPPNTAPLLIPLMEALCALLRYAHEVYFDRIEQRITQASKRATESTRGVLETVFDVMRILTSPLEQASLIAGKIKSLERACDPKSWRSFCGRTHVVPTDRIKALHAEVLKIKEMK